MTLKEKAELLSIIVCGDLRRTITQAIKSNAYPDFETAFKQVRLAERHLAAVRAQILVHMRKTKETFQKACPHTAKVDTRVRHTSEGQRVVEIQACTNCSKTFDLRERVQ